jgi:hypothetical protein
MVRGLQDTTNEGKIGVWLGKGGSGLFSLYSTSIYDDDSWHHLVATIDRDGLATLYIDGGNGVVSIDISSLASIDQSTTEDLEIGRERIWGQYWFEALIDEVAIYNRCARLQLRLYTMLLLINTYFYYLRQLYILPSGISTRKYEYPNI